MENPEINLKSKALDFLSRRDYGYHELYIKLQKYSDDLDEIKQVLDDLRNKNFLSEARYINSYFRNKQAKYGIRKIRYELLQKNVDPDVLDEVLAACQSDEYTIAYAVWQLKFGVIATDSKERLRQMRFLQSRGFSSSVIAKIVSGR